MIPGGPKTVFKKFAATTKKYDQSLRVRRIEQFCWDTTDEDLISNGFISCLYRELFTVCFRQKYLTEVSSIDSIIAKMFVKK